MKYFCWALCCFLLICSCKTREKVEIQAAKQIVEPVRDGYNITGQLDNFKAGSQVILQLIEGGIRPINIDTAVLDADGKFAMNKKLLQSGIARFLIAPNHSILTVIQAEDYAVGMDASKKPFSTVEGNPTAEEFSALWNRLNKEPLTEQEARTLVDTTRSPYSAFVVASNVKDSLQIELLKLVQKRMAAETTDSLFVSNLSLMIEQKELKYEVERKTAIGATAPEVVSLSPKGEELKLSSLRGKYVFVDFWASWCGPCRRENPHVIEAWKKYQANGFEVFGISLDGNKDRWLQAIEQDGLAWEYHVSELQKWKSAAASDYGVQSIPANFLLDPEGKIIAKNLRGIKLLQTLDKIWKAE